MDAPRFLAAERTDPTFLACYASFVKQKSYTPEYLDRTRRIIPVISDLFQNQLVQ
jgi:hypothetical protein